MVVIELAWFGVKLGIGGEWLWQADVCRGCVCGRSGGLERRRAQRRMNEGNRAVTASGCIHHIV